MRITANQIQLRNLQQLARVTTPDGVTIMGRLNEVAFCGDVYALVIGGSVFEVPGDHPVDIRRSANLDALVNISDDVAEGLEADHAA